MPRGYIIDPIRTPSANYGERSFVCSSDDAAARDCDLVDVPPPKPLTMWFLAAQSRGEDNRNVARTATLLAGLPGNSAGRNK